MNLANEALQQLHEAKALLTNPNKTHAISAKTLFKTPRHDKITAETPNFSAPYIQSPFC